MSRESAFQRVYLLINVAVPLRKILKKQKKDELLKVRHFRFSFEFIHAIMMLAVC